MQVYIYINNKPHPPITVFLIIDILVLAFSLFLSLLFRLSHLLWCLALYPFFIHHHHSTLYYRQHGTTHVRYSIRLIIHANVDPIG